MRWAKVYQGYGLWISGSNPSPTKHQPWLKLAMKVKTEEWCQSLFWNQLGWEGLKPALPCCSSEPNPIPSAWLFYEDEKDIGSFKLPPHVSSGLAPIFLYVLHLWMVYACVLLTHCIPMFSVVSCKVIRPSKWRGHKWYPPMLSSFLPWFLLRPSCLLWRLIYAFSQ